jgi:hypothetical protein
MQVGEETTLTVPGSPAQYQQERSLRGIVRAEGPTCVLSVMDLQVGLC